jgi:hypothetical protein
MMNKISIVGLVFWVSKTTFNSILILSWWSASTVKESVVLKKATNLLQATDKLYDTLYQAHLDLAMLYIQLLILVVIDTECISA